MTSIESTEPASSIYDSCDPKYLRDLREASGMDVFVLARTACLSVAQVRQLESDAGGNLFYSLTIKRQAYKRLLMILGAEPPTVEVPEAFRQAHQVADAHLNTLDQIVAMNQLPRMQRSTGEVLGETFDRLMAHKQAIGALLMLLVAVLLFLKFGQPPGLEPAASVPAAASTVASTVTPSPPASGVPSAAVIVAPAPAPASAASAVSVAAAPAAATVSSAKTAACAFTEEELSVLTPYTAKKEGRFVYVVSAIDTDICLVDGAKQATSVSLKMGEGRSIYGAAPWQISSANLPKVQIFFQGGRVSLPDPASTRVKLVEVPVSR